MVRLSALVEVEGTYAYVCLRFLSLLLHKGVLNSMKYSYRVPYQHTHRFFIRRVYIRQSSFSGTHVCLMMLNSN